MKMRSLYFKTRVLVTKERSDEQLEIEADASADTIARAVSEHVRRKNIGVLSRFVWSLVAGSVVVSRRSYCRHRWHELSSRRRDTTTPERGRYVCRDCGESGEALAPGKLVHTTGGTPVIIESEQRARSNNQVVLLMVVARPRTDKEYRCALSPDSVQDGYVRATA